MKPAGLKLQLLVVLCEGVKAMGAMQAKISSPEALKRFAEAGYYPVASLGSPATMAQAERITPCGQQTRIMSSPPRTTLPFPVEKFPGPLRWIQAIKARRNAAKLP